MFTSAPEARRLKLGFLPTPGQASILAETTLPCHAANIHRASEPIVHPSLSERIDMSVAPAEPDRWRSPKWSPSSAGIADVRLVVSVDCHAHGTNCRNTLPLTTDRKPLVNGQANAERVRRTALRQTPKVSRSTSVTVASANREGRPITAAHNRGPPGRPERRPGCAYGSVLADTCRLEEGKRSGDGDPGPGGMGPGSRP